MIPLPTTESAKSSNCLNWSIILPSPTQCSVITVSSTESNSDFITVTAIITSSARPSPGTKSVIISIGDVKYSIAAAIYNLFFS